jgi:hypothetical protein
MTTIERTRIRATWRTSLIPILGLGLSLLAAEEAMAASQPSGRTGPSEEMHAVFEAIVHLLPLAMDEATWADPVNRAEIEEWTQRLDARAVSLLAHAEQRDVGFRHLSRSLAEDVSEIRVRFDLGRLEEARFFVLESTGNCVACHSRLPSSEEFVLASRLLDRLDYATLQPHERAHLLVITRQFARSLDVWEEILADPQLAPGRIDAGGYLLDYLIISVRVRRDPDRAIRTLRLFLARPDVPSYVQRDVRSWIRALEAMKAELLREPAIENARALVRGQVGPKPGLMGKEQVVYDLVASSILLRLIDRAGGANSGSAEAFYLLGLVGARSVDSFWAPQAEFHLEASIRLDPTAPFAEDAYAALEECIAIGYGGASGGELPVDIMVKLSELRTLIEEGRVLTPEPEEGKEGR